MMLPLSCLLLLCSWSVCCCEGYVSPAIRERWAAGYTKEEAIQTIEECAEEGDALNTQDDLFCAVKYLDRFGSSLHYKDDKVKQELMAQCQGSWELRLALNSDRDQEFYPHPEFRSFAMAFITVEDDYFGKGIAPNPTFCFVSIAGPSTQNYKTRQVFMEYEDYYINGRTVPGWDLSYYLRGYQRNWVSTERKRPPLAFTVIMATENAMVVRGSKTGGIAIFRRIQDDMRPAAYGV
ncbi:expressed unknown protein [Seminavis robusta]|uniref:Uncharacterized protein n=1 Tax=Seminavis robusta TaxID=568900 RepID=A0A9N8DCV6_9STRA|nr:expressed unknown protein [Seminavis robusta]|eukprot:Sro81_g043590.1 n/a (236) ;mRNA; r:106651-107358